MKNIILLFTILLLFPGASSVSAQSVECLLPKIKQASKEKAPRWKIEHSMAFDETVFIYWKLGEEWAKVQVKMLPTREEAEKYFEKEALDTNGFFKDANVGASKYSANLGDGGDMWTGYYEGNTILIFRRNNMYVRVETSSVNAARAFGQLVADEIPAI